LNTAVRATHSSTLTNVIPSSSITNPTSSRLELDVSRIRGNEDERHELPRRIPRSYQEIFELYVERIPWVFSALQFEELAFHEVENHIIRSDSVDDPDAHVSAVVVINLEVDVLSRHYG
jgi:hypothetical protein